MGSLILHTRVQARDSLGRYLAKITEECRRTIEDTATRGAAVARGGAPVKTGALQGSIHGVVFSAREGGITVGTDHWRYQNDGTAPHPITGNVTFYWAKANEGRGRMWTPGRNTISHPGNPALHFMDHAQDFVRSYFMAAARRNFS